MSNLEAMFEEMAIPEPEISAGCSSSSAVIAEAEDLFEEMATPEPKVSLACCSEMVAEDESAR